MQKCRSKLNKKKIKLREHKELSFLRIACNRSLNQIKKIDKNENDTLCISFHKIRNWKQEWFFFRKRFFTINKSSNKTKIHQAKLFEPAYDFTIGEIKATPGNMESSKARTNTRTSSIFSKMTLYFCKECKNNLWKRSVLYKFGKSIYRLSEKMFCQFCEKFYWTKWLSEQKSQKKNYSTEL